jgi:hypothetical protein
MSIIGRLAHLAYRDWSDGKRDPVLRTTDPGVEITLFGFGTYTGREGVSQAWTEWTKSFGDDARIEVMEVIDNRTGTFVLVIGFKGSMQETHQDIGQPGAIVWSVEDGMIVRGSFHPHKADALQAAGLSE